MRLASSRGNIPDALNGDEASRVHGAEVVQGVHGRLFLGVELLRSTGATEDIGVALVELQPDLTIDPALREQQAVFDELTLGGKVHAVVQLVTPVVADELIAQVTDLGIHD